MELIKIVNLKRINCTAILKHTPNFTSSQLTMDDEIILTQIFGWKDEKWNHYVSVLVNKLV